MEKLTGKTFNLKKKEFKTEEWLIWNHDYKNTSIMLNNKRSHNRVLPKEIDQVTETIIWNDKVAIFVYTSQPLVIVMDNTEIFKMYKSHFDFLWKLSKDVK